MRETAYAKINLALHVRARRKDGYHDIETLFAFVDCGDLLSAKAAEADSLQVVGEFGTGLGDPAGNLVARTLGALPRPGGLAVTLDKRIPVSAGLGGGSADAAAVFRMVREAHGLPDDWYERAATLGADVPACIKSTMVLGRGIGTRLEPVEDDLTGTPVLLVNPRVPLATAEVYGGWDGHDRGPLPDGPASRIAFEGRNDLEGPAMKECPQIVDLLFALDESEPLLARMSGSGASCFALYREPEARDEAAARLAEKYPEWWRMTGALR